MNVYAGLDVSSRETSVCIRLRMLLGCRKLVVRKLVDVENPVCRRLMTIPGVGPVATLAFRTGVDDPKRFKRSRTVAAHFGMTPRRFQSGGGRLQRPHLQVMAIGRSARRSSMRPAHCSRRCRKACALRTWGLRIMKRSGIKKATVAVSRKLAVIMHRMWLDGTEFRWSRDSAVAPSVQALQ